MLNELTLIRESVRAGRRARAEGDPGPRAAQHHADLYAREQHGYGTRHAKESPRNKEEIEEIKNTPPIAKGKFR